MARRNRPRRRFRRLVVLAGTVSGVTALRNVMLARNEKRYADLIAGPPTGPPS
jgi:hypothetical protein